MDARPPRSRVRVAGWITVVVTLGLASRSWRADMPAWVGAYAGDALWATCAYLVIAWLRPALAARWVFAAAVAVAFAVELSQLWRTEWLDALRATRVGALLLGHGFVWSDLPCYVVGAGLGLAMEGALRRDTPRDGDPAGGR